MNPSNEQSSDYINAHFDELLSAFMDGELSKDELRFLQKRLSHDVALRERWQRWQIGSACLRGHALEWLDADIASNISAAIEPIPVPKQQQSKRWAGVALAAAMVFAIALMPRMLTRPQGDSALSASENTRALIVADSQENTAPIELPAAPSLAISAAATNTKNGSDLPWTNQGKSKPWPRSPLIGREDAALEGYLVRHNGLLAEEGLDGFLPAADVMTHNDMRVSTNEDAAQ